MPRARPTLRTRLARGLAWLGSLIVVSAGVAFAQAPEPQAEPAEKAAETPPESIAIPEIAMRSEEDASLLRAIEAGLEKDDAVDAIAEAITGLVEDDAALIAETARQARARSAATRRLFSCRDVARPARRDRGQWRDAHRAGERARIR